MERPAFLNQMAEVGIWSYIRDLKDNTNYINHLNIIFNNLNNNNLNNSRNNKSNHKSNHKSNNKNNKSSSNNNNTKMK